MAEPASYTIRPSSGAGALLSVVPVALFCTVGFALGGGERGLIVGAAIFVLFRLTLVRRIVLKDHALGVRLTRVGRFEEALAAFARSEATWQRRPFLDRHRALLLGSSVRYTFLCLSLFNQAYCLGRLGRGDDALAMLDRLEVLAPNSSLARSLRDLLEARGPADPAPGTAPDGRSTDAPGAEDSGDFTAGR